MAIGYIGQKQAKESLLYLHQFYGGSASLRHKLASLPQIVLPSEKRAIFKNQALPVSYFFFVKRLFFGAPRKTDVLISEG